jgi:hypothetical protein
MPKTAGNVNARALKWKKRDDEEDCYVAGAYRIVDMDDGWCPAIHFPPNQYSNGVGTFKVLAFGIGTLAEAKAICQQHFDSNK